LAFVNVGDLFLLRGDDGSVATVATAAAAAATM